MSMWDTRTANNLQLRGLITICAVILFTYMSQSVYSAIIPLYLAEYGYNPAGIGIIILANLLASSALSIPFGIVSDRVGRKTTIAFGTGLAVAGSALFLYGDVQLSILAYTLLGIGHGAYGPGTQAYPADISSGRSLGRAIGWSQGIRQVAIICGPVLAYFTKAGMGYGATFATGTSLMAVGLLVTLLLLSQVRIQSVGRKPEKAPRAQGRLTLSGPILAFLVLVLSSSFAFGTFQAFVPLYASMNGVATETIGFIFAAQAFTSIASRTVIGELLRRSNKQTAIVTACIVPGSVALASVGLFGTLEPLMLVAAVLGFSQGTAVVTSALGLANLADEKRRGFVLAFFNTSLYAGQGIGPASIGQVISASNFQTGFQAASLTPLIGIFALVVAMRKTQTKSNFY